MNDSDFGVFEKFMIVSVNFGIFITEIGLSTFSAFDYDIAERNKFNIGEFFKGGKMLTD